jgi:hypothetical protein
MHQDPDVGNTTPNANKNAFGTGDYVSLPDSRTWVQLIHVLGIVSDCML